ncbi:MAG: DUF2971 domain-containing protein [Bacteroidetes bacterium]|jgi:hypothetical protein|nr:DUF2971 domain-containing protein [Bacteroidota bacterium]MBT6685159.1 DUF2971 domain-containing protein [Bacteroidota bacterium]MBT7142070.1 DUF2971 domain-containing protein [Bacteroidota bacterium]MBT7493392.1 DUF2971 domain-containing protein [Bacteroidota bacterium]
MYIDNIPNEFKGQNVLYHYTEASTALEYILADERLKLSPRKKSADPIENSEINYIVCSSRKDFNTKNIDHEKIDKIITASKEKEESLKQICFCVNKDEKKYEYYQIRPHEYYGFLKPRMWDQYGDRYNGVCLAFNQTVLSDKNADIDHASKVKYLRYIDLHPGINVKIEEAFLGCWNTEDYVVNFKEYMNTNAFKKHRDYINEDEFRIIKYSKKDCYLSIKDCLLGIVISSNLSSYQTKTFYKYAIDYKVPIVRILWDNSDLKFDIKKGSDLDSFISI